MKKTRNQLIKHTQRNKQLQKLTKGKDSNKSLFNTHNL